MPFQRNKEVRATILKYLYEKLQDDPHAMFDHFEVLSACGITRDELKRNVFYMEEAGWIECMKSYENTLFAAIRIAPGGVDMVEDVGAFESKFGVQAIVDGEIDDDVAAALWHLRELALCNFGDPDIARDQIRLLESLFKKGGANGRIKAITEWLAEDYSDLDAAHAHLERIRNAAESETDNG